MRIKSSSHGSAVRALRGAVASRSGSASVWAIFWTIGFLMIGGVSVDVTNAFAYKSRMQSVADAAALAAALNIDDVDAARAAAADIVERNMPPARHGAVMTASDVEFGVFDPDTRTFTETADAPDSVQVAIGRTLSRGNAVPTWLLRLAGKDEWEVGAQSVSTVRRGGGGGGGGGGTPDCTGVTIVSTGFVHTGGGNFYGSGICIHGDEGIATGGGDCHEIGSHLSAPPGATVTINGAPSMCANAKDTVQEPNIIVESEHPTPILDRIANGYFEEVWDAVKYSYDNDKRKWYGIDKRGGHEDEDDQNEVVLPDYLLGASGYAAIVRVTSNWWNVDNIKLPGNIIIPALSSNTIYLADGGVQLTGGIEAKNVAIIAKGAIQTGGGPGLQFDHVYFFGKGRLNFAGNTTWGDADAYCADGIYRAYLLSESALSFGGFGPKAGAHGVIGAAPSLGLGGALKSAGGIYFETTDGYTSLGGGMTLRSCTGPLASTFADLDALTGAVQPGEGGSGLTVANGANPAGGGNGNGSGNGGGNGNGNGTDTTANGIVLGAELVR
jgi:hypothetical protein